MEADTEGCVWQTDFSYLWIVWVVGISEEESDVQDLDWVETPGNLAGVIGGVGHNGNHSDFFFGDGDLLDQVNFDYDVLGGVAEAPVSVHLSLSSRP